MEYKSLLMRFKKVYEVETGLRISWSNIDAKGHLTVGIADKNGKEKFWLNVKEDKGNIIWW